MELHARLWKVCRDLVAYQNGTDTNNHELSDCSCGCEWFVQLRGKEGNDWGVCTCQKSPRAGLLTFEHMGCSEFKK